MDASVWLSPALSFVGSGLGALVALLVASKQEAGKAEARRQERIEQQYPELLEAARQLVAWAQLDRLHDDRGESMPPELPRPHAFWSDDVELLELKLSVFRQLMASAVFNYRNNPDSKGANGELAAQCVEQIGVLHSELKRTIKAELDGTRPRKRRE